MARIPELPTVTLGHDDIVAFWRDGAICVRQLYSAEWREKLSTALADLESLKGGGVARMQIHRDYSESFAWLSNDTIRDFVLEGPSAWIAKQLFGSATVNFYYDQIFIKNNNDGKPTPWHQDYTFWPLEGDQILSLWTSLDPVSAENSALEFIPGSHRWPQRYKAISADGTDLSSEIGLSDLPDIDGNRDDFKVLSWDLEPGDALVFHALTLHGARGNASADTRRRAITTRWCGDDVRYSERGIPFPITGAMKPGDRLGGLDFPRVLPTLDEEALAPRMAGFFTPDPQIIAEAGQKFAIANAAARKAGEAVA